MGRYDYRVYFLNGGEKGVILTYEIFNLSTGGRWDEVVEDAEDMVGIIPREALVYNIEPTRAI